MPSNTAWIEKRDTWLAFCKGMGEATRTLGTTGRIYYNFRGPYGEIFPSWKRCDEFMKRKLQSLPIPVEDVKEENHAPNVETVLSRCRSAEINSFTVDDEKLDTIIGSNNFELEVSARKSYHSQAEPSESSDEKWVEVNADLLSSRISGIRKTSDPADVKFHGPWSLETDRDLDDTLVGSKEHNLLDSESRNYRVIADMKARGKETVSFSSQFGAQSGHPFRIIDLEFAGLGNFNESTRNEPFVNHLKGQSIQNSVEDRHVIIRNPASGEHGDGEEPNPHKSKENVLLLQLPCGGDSGNSKRINDKSEKEEGEKRIKSLRFPREKARFSDRIRRNHERAFQMSRTYGSAQRPAAIHLFRKRSKGRNTSSGITNDSDMLLSILWRKYMLYRRSKRRSTSPSSKKRVS